MSKEFVTAPADIAKLVTSIMQADDASSTGRTTYLRSLVATLQQTLGGKPVLRVTGRPKRPEIEAAVEAFEQANAVFYGAVLEAVPAGLDAAAKQSRTSFARSTAATVRRALKAGWNPLGEACTAVSKGRLAAFSKEHSSPRPVSPSALEKRVMRYTGRIADMVAALPKEEASRVLGMVLADLGVDAPSAPTVPLRNVSVRRTERAVPH